MGASMGLRTVKVPPEMEALFARAEELVSRYFRDRHDDPEHGTIEIFGERYVLVRAASLSVEFFALVEELYGAGREREGEEFARNILFDLAHAIGRQDAHNFHCRMGLVDPIARLSAGPVHFSHTGWAFVDIFPESRPTPDEDFYLIYEHPYSFEADAWVRSGRRRASPSCFMNAGYSSGWCEESFGVKLVAAEVRCRAMGDEACRFVMAHPDRIEQHVSAQVPRGPLPIPDFFARKRMEEELRRAHAELEQRVELRTAELKREMEARREAEKQLERRERLESLGRLAGGVAHDFNNLMAVVLTNLTLARRHLGPDDPLRPLLDEIGVAGTRAAELTRQLLDFASARSGDLAPVELDGVVREATRLLGRLLGADIDLRLELGAPGALVLSDRAQLEQVVVNLGVNTRDAMPRGGTLTLSTESVRLDEAQAAELGLPGGAGAAFVRLRVVDTGVGMDAATLARIFDPFFTTKELGRGTGLGLSTVYGFVQRAGGAISVTSAPGQGTSFVIHLPRVEAPPVVESAPQPEAARGRETVLLVEDQDMLRRALVVTLEDLGYRVLEAGSAREALDVAASAGPALALVITDLLLPDQSGVDLAARLESERPSLRILFMSGNPRDTLEARQRSGRPTAFLQKPFTAESLAAKLRELLD
jgi:signal transduction histidine kinase